MMDGLPLAVWFGILTIISLFVTTFLGMAVHRGKRVFKHHRFFAFLTLTLAIIHITLVIFEIYLGIIV